MKEIEGITLSVNKYKDNDAILNVLTKKEIISLHGRGIFKENSKNHKFINKFIYANFDCYEGPTKGLKLRNANIIEYYPFFFKTYDSYIIVDLLSELIIKTNENNDYEKTFYLLKQYLDNLKNSNDLSFIYGKLIYFLFSYLNVLGILPVKESDSILYFSFKDGSFNDQYKENDYKLSSDEESLIKALYSNDELTNYPTATQISIIRLFLTFIESCFSIKLNSINLL